MNNNQFQNLYNLLNVDLNFDMNIVVDNDMNNINRYIRIINGLNNDLNNINGNGNINNIEFVRLLTKVVNTMESIIRKIEELFNNQNFVISIENLQTMVNEIRLFIIKINNNYEGLVNYNYHNFMNRMIFILNYNNQYVYNNEELQENPILTNSLNILFNNINSLIN